MKIRIENHSSFLKFDQKIKKAVSESIIYILGCEKEKGNKKLKKFLKKTDLRKVEVNFRFIDDKEMKKYNKQYFNRTGTTDVISFSGIEGEECENNTILGDIIISVETAMKNSAVYGHSLKEEVFLLIIHGILHSAGYDHTDKDCLMRRKERKYFNCMKTKWL